MRELSKGDKYRPRVEILKTKRGLPTVVKMSGRTYVYRPEDIHQKKKGGRK